MFIKIDNILFRDNQLIPICLIMCLKENSNDNGWCKWCFKYT